MRVKISLNDGTTSVSIKFRGGGVVHVQSGSRAVTIGDDGRRGVENVAVTPAMRAEAVRTFLAQGDPVRLGRALAEVYDAMERVRMAGLDEDDNWD